jgi:hypothetical protein
MSLYGVVVGGHVQDEPTLIFFVMQPNSDF